eukprot:364849-Chlamydomonas_euryale.AAC.11
MSRSGGSLLLHCLCAGRGEGRKTSTQCGGGPVTAKRQVCLTATLACEHASIRTNKLELPHAPYTCASTPFSPRHAPAPPT